MEEVLYLSLISWDRIRQRPQFIAEGLAKDKKIYYINPPYSFADYFFSKLKLTPKKVSFFPSNSCNINNNLKIISLPLRPLPNFPLIFNKLYSKILKRQIKQRVNINRITYIYCTHPFQYYLIKNIDNKKIIYDIMDDYPNAYKGLTKKVVHKLHLKLIKEADFITVSSKYLINREIIQKKHLIVPNGFDELTFSKKTYDKKINDPRKIIGYIGYIGNWFDTEKIIKFAKRNPSYLIVLVGPNHLKKPYFKKYKNILLTGQVPHKDIPNYIASFDVCLCPFKQSEFINKVNPIKIYEYLAMGKPVVAVKTPETLGFSKYIYLYNTYQEFEKSILSIKTSFINKRNLKLFLKNNSWECRIKQINDFIFKAKFM